MNWRNTWAVLAWVVLAMSTGAVCHASQAFNSLEMGGGQRSKPLTHSGRHEQPVLEMLEQRQLLDGISLTGVTYFDPDHRLDDDGNDYTLTITDVPAGTTAMEIYWGDGTSTPIGSNFLGGHSHDYTLTSPTGNHSDWTIAVKATGGSCPVGGLVVTKTIKNDLPSVLGLNIDWSAIYGNTSEAMDILSALKASGLRYVPLEGCVAYGDDGQEWTEDVTSWVKGLLPSFASDDFSFKTKLNFCCTDDIFTKTLSSQDPSPTVTFTDGTKVYKQWLYTVNGQYTGQTTNWQEAICPNRSPVEAPKYNDYFTNLHNAVAWTLPDFVTVSSEIFEDPRNVDAYSPEVIAECNDAYNLRDFAGYQAAIQGCWVNKTRDVVDAINSNIKIINFRSMNAAYSDNAVDAAIGNHVYFPEADYPSPGLYHVTTGNIEGICEHIAANPTGLGYPWLYPTGTPPQYTSLSVNEFDEVCSVLHDNGAKGIALYSNDYYSSTSGSEMLPYLRIAAQASSWVHVTNVMSGGTLKAAVSVDGIAGLSGASVTLIGIDDDSLFHVNEDATITLIGTTPQRPCTVTVKVAADGQVYVGKVSVTPPPVITLDGDSGKVGLASNVTLFNNIGQFRTIKFDITDAITGAFIQVFADGTSDVIASGTADQDGNVVLTTAPTGAGYHGLTPGRHVITVRQTPTDGTTSADASYTLIVNALRLNEGIFTTGNDSIYQGVVGKLSFYLNTPIQDKSQASVSIFKWNGSDWGNAVVTVNNTNDSTNHVTLGTNEYGDKVDCDLLTYETGGGEYSWGTSLGWYRATITIGGLSQSWVFARLPADFTFDGHVNFSDYLVLEQAFNRFGTYLPGDGNLDGAVNFIDYLMLEQKFNTAAGDPPTVVAG